MNDRPLTDAQERALIRLADFSPSWVSGYGMRTNTLESLERLGLAECRMRVGYGPFTEARITPAGLAMLNTMGD